MEPRNVRLLSPALVVAVASTCLLAMNLPASAATPAPTDTRPASEAVDLAQRYPTTLDAGDLEPNKAREWTFTRDDIYALSGFRLHVGDDLKIDVGAAFLGVGHASDGAVWAVVLPSDDAPPESAAITSSVGANEAVAHIWLRFHPREIGTLFPPATVRAAGPADEALFNRMQRIVRAKFRNSFHAGDRAMIPERNQMTVDTDVRSKWRRFFVVDTAAGTATYHEAFAARALAPPQPLSQPADVAASFDKLWEAFDQHYAMFVLRPEVDWNALRAEYRPKALAARDQEEFAEVCAALLRPLRDLHVWVRAGETPVEVFNRPRTANANPDAYEALLGPLHAKGGGLRWTRTKDAIGFVMIPGWSNGRIPDNFDQVLEELRDTRGLIVDVRLNGGGSEPLAQQVAGRFTDQETVYAYSRVRNGPRHDDLSDKRPRSFSPRGPWRYDRPVVLLIGQKCMSSNESFVAMLGACPNVTTMGDHTCGSSGNPMMVDLPIGVTVSVPQWIDVRLDGQPLDERGEEPDVRFEPSPGAFEGTRDDLLTAALERLRAVPLPGKPIAGPALASTPPPAPSQAPAPELAGVAKWADDPNRPHVIEVAPAKDATDVDPQTELRIRFDRPMDPRLMELTWRAGTYRVCGDARYDAERREFIIPVLLPPNTAHRVGVNLTWGADEPKGFTSSTGVAAAPFVWEFHTRGAAVAADARPPKLVSVDPSSGAQASIVTRVVVRFDQPMDPAAYRLVGSKPGDVPGDEHARLLPSVAYDTTRNEFTFIVVLPPDSRPRFELRDLRSARGVAAEPLTLEYTTDETLFSPAHAQELTAAAAAPELRSVLEGVRQMRSALTSLSESVTEVVCLEGPEGFQGVHSYSSTFKMQGPRRFFGDVTSYMTPARCFQLGSDGERCWWRYQGPGEPTLVVCPYDTIAEKQVSLCSPFGDLTDDLTAAARRGNLEYLGTATVDGHRCHHVRGWDAGARTSGPHRFSEGTLFDWYVDAETWRPLRVEQIVCGARCVRRYAYDRVNEPIPLAEFAPPVVADLPPTDVAPLDEGYDRRFLILEDGSEGAVRLRWGQRGPKGRSSSGLN